jgi:hypothetical protein
MATASTVLLLALMPPLSSGAARRKRIQYAAAFQRVFPQVTHALS